MPVSILGNHGLFFVSESSRMIVDIKELKLLGDFNHPNIVRFVRHVLACSYECH